MNIEKAEAELQSDFLSTMDAVAFTASLRATHVWYGPHSPLHEQNERKADYLHIFFPNHI